MKKTIWVIALVLILLTTACGKKGLVGKWRYDGSTTDYYYIFNDDKTCAYEMAGARMECTYEDDGTKVTILYNGNTLANTYEYRIVGDKLIIEDNTGKDVTYIKQ